MRKLKLQMQMSINGFVGGPNGELDWATWDWGDDIKNYVTELTNSIDSILLGRKLAEGFIPHWANVYADKDHPENAAGKIYTETQKYVFSKTLTKSLWENTTVLSGDLSKEVIKIKEQQGKDVIAYGGASFVSSLIKEGLIDEYNLFINPAAIGKGKTIFAELIAKQNLKLVDSIAFDCGINLLCYTVNDN